MIEKKQAVCSECIHVAVCGHVKEFKELSDLIETITHSPLFSVTVSCKEQKHYEGIPRSVDIRNYLAAMRNIKKGVE